MKKAGHNVRLTAVLLTLLLGSCISGDNTFVVDIDPAGWAPQEAITLRFPNNDTVSLRRIDIILVYDHQLTDQGPLELLVTTVTPDSARFSELVTVLPPGNNKKSDPHYKEAVFPYRESIRYDRPGEYKITFSHSHPTPLRGLKAAGVVIENQ